MGVWVDCHGVGEGMEVTVYIQTVWLFESAAEQSSLPRLLGQTGLDWTEVHCVRASAVECSALDYEQ